MRLMSLREVRAAYVACFVFLGLIILSPTLAMVLSFPNGERFSELWILGPEHKAENYPFIIKANQTYSVFLGIGNHMGDLEYYKIYAKFGNESEPLPDAENGTPSPMAPIYEYRVFLNEAQVWEREVNFSLVGLPFKKYVYKVEYLKMDDVILAVNKTLTRNLHAKHYYCRLFFELWMYEPVLEDFQYQKRFVRFGFNVTA